MTYCLFYYFLEKKEAILLHLLEPKRKMAYHKRHIIDKLFSVEEKITLVV